MICDFNVFFDKNRIHNFFYNQNIYSDIIDTEVILLPYKKKKNILFIQKIIFMRIGMRKNLII